MATLSDVSKSGAPTLTDTKKSGRFGDYTMAQLAAYPISQFADATFDTPLALLTDTSKSSAPTLTDVNKS